MGQQCLDGLAFVLMGTPQAVLGIGPDRVQDGLPQPAVVDIDRNRLAAGPTMGVVTVESIGQPIDNPVKKRRYRRQHDALTQALGIVGDRLFIDRNARLGAAIDAQL